MNLYEDLIDELNEIRDDLRWSNSKSGLYVIELNKWVESFYDDLNDLIQSSRLVVGGHAEKKVVLITGRKSSQKELNDLVEFLESKRPPFPIYIELLE